MRGLNKLFAALIVGAFLALPAGALAQSSTGGYNQPGGVVQDQIQTQPEQAQARTNTAAAKTPTATPAAATQAAPAKQASNGQLPFTGLDLALVVAAGGVLMLLGFGIRRFTRATEAV